MFKTSKVYVPPNKRKQENMFVIKDTKFKVKEEDFPEMCKPQIKQEKILDWSKSKILEETEIDLKQIIKEEQEELDIENQKVYYQMSNELSKSIINRHNRYEEEDSYKNVNYGYCYVWQILEDILIGDDEYEDEYKYENEDEYEDEYKYEEVDVEEVV